MMQHKYLRLTAFAAVLAVSSLSAVTQAAPAPYQAASAYPLTLDRGASGLWQSLQKLKTRASLMMVVAHPDDEDSGMLAFEARGNGVDATLLTLNRGEGGQNVMTGNYWDQLGILRTQELLAAGDYFGVHQRFTRVADFGFSKTLEEALKTWGQDRVLYDVVRQVRITRPLVVNSVFAGNLSDGHGHHQTAGMMAQLAYKLAGDPKVFPEQLKDGLRPWSPLKVYARVPFAIVQEGKIFDYATGHWEPVHYRNYVTDSWIDGLPSTTLRIQEGSYNPLFGRSYLAVAREGLDKQKSQNGGVAIPPARPFASPYHLYASRVSATLPQQEKDYFDGIDTSLAGIAAYAPTAQQAEWSGRLKQLQATVDEAAKAYDATDPSKSAPALARGLKQTRELLAQLKASKLPEDAKYNMQHELALKETQFNDALGQSLAVSVLATVSAGPGAGRLGPMGDLNGGATAQTVIPGQPVAVALNIADQGGRPVQLAEVTVQPSDGKNWNFTTAKPATGEIAAGNYAAVTFSGTVPQNADITRPYFSRPNLEQSYYDVHVPQDLGLPTMPYPLTARVAYTYEGVKAEVAGVVQTVHKLNGGGPTLEPLLVAPAISVRVTPQVGVVPIDNDHLMLRVTIGSDVKGPARGTVKLNLPAGWTSTPETATFATARDGDEEGIDFTIATKNVAAKRYDITAVATYNGKQYSEGFITIGYPGIRPYPMYYKADYHANGVDVKVAPDLKVAYIAGTGDDIPASLENLGIHVTQLSPQDVVSSDLSGYDAIVLGIRTYAARTELRSSNARLLEYAKNGGIVISQYQTAEYDHNYGPYPISVPGDAEKVVEEDAKVTILAPQDPMLNWPNKIGTADFDNWVEERGHGFMRQWDSHYVALTEMHDAGQDPQKGGLLYARYGKGAYVYMSYAFFRQMPDGVPGSFRIMANLLSMAKNPGLALGKEPAATNVGTK
jgi:LmbE family N-acetylglucosaminyl deacetylase